MLFNSLDFAVFLPIVFFLYWFVLSGSLRLQNAFLVVASYFFYGWWDWRFLFLIIFSTLVDFSVGIYLNKYQSPSRRKAALWVSVITNLGFLGFFKYYNFFLENFESAFSFFGYQVTGTTLAIILPVGISFYTFQTLSYTIDIYRNNIQACRSLISFAAFVSFFPQLVAGPIERASRLLPQFYKEREFKYSEGIDGLRQILWGLFKKIVIADNCAVYANYIFENSENLSGSTLFLGAIFFSFQIYGDFSGYSDIAIGTAKLFGFQLMQNFAFPYFSRDIAEFWRRWHISLSTWFRDYLYIPLGGSRGGNYLKVRNIFIIFIVSGFWHGASWTFIVWGALNALYFLPLLLTKRNRQNMEVVAINSRLPSLKETLQILFTFSLTVLAWIFFRAENLVHAYNYLSGIFSSSFFSIPDYDGFGFALDLILPGTIFLIVEWIGRRDRHALENQSLPGSRSGRWIFYSFIIFVIGMFMHLEETHFIYFDF